LKGTDESPLLSIAYVSVATHPMSDDAIDRLLRRARANNGRDGITGALLYHGGRFVQIVEGPAEKVLERFETISRDPRHRSIQKMREKRIPERQFAQWTMALRNPSANSSGYDDFFSRRGLTRLEHADNEAQQFLEWLSEYWLPAA